MTDADVSKASRAKIAQMDYIWRTELNGDLDWYDVIQLLIWEEIVPNFVVTSWNGYRN